MNTEGLNARSNIHCIAEYVVVFKNNFTIMNTDSERKAAEIFTFLLDPHGSIQSIRNGRKTGHDAIANFFY